MTAPLRTARADALARVEVAAPRGTDLGAVLSAAPAAPFADGALDFIADLSRAILTGRDFRAYPELIAFAHWMRRRTLLDMKARFEADAGDRLLSARGLAMHIAPANVDTIFLYSLLLSLIAGNANVVRVSSRRSDQIEVLIATLDGLLARPEHASVAGRMAIVRYDRDDAINAALSAAADLRVLWGGDDSVMAMRAIPAQPHTRDVCFPDRWSLAVLDAATVADAADDTLTRLANDFANDSYWFGQMACSSPRLVVWRGTDARAQAAGDRFWPALDAAAARFRGELFAVDYVNKLVAVDELTIDHDAAAIRKGPDNVVSVARLRPGACPDMGLHSGAGLFLETTVPDLSGLGPLVPKKAQSVVSHGIDRQDWVDFLRAHSPRGIDRVVPVGAALTFAPVWDGMDLLREFTKETTVSL